MTPSEKGKRATPVLLAKYGPEHFRNLGKRRAELAGPAEMARIGRLGGEQYVRKYVTALTGTARRSWFSSPWIEPQPIPQSELDRLPY